MKQKIGWIIPLLALLVFSGCSSPVSTPNNGSETSYTNLPAAANGTWAMNGSALFSVNNSQMDLGGTVTAIKYDADTGFIYISTSGTWTVLTGYSWNGSAFVVSGATLTKATTTPSTSYTDLPATANGTWAMNGIALFSVNNSQMNLGGTVTAIKYDADTGFIYVSNSGTWTVMPGYSWNGSAFVAGSMPLTKA